VPHLVGALSHERKPAADRNRPFPDFSRP
jgi:hypothetical protein